MKQVRLGYSFVPKRLSVLLVVRDADSQRCRVGFREATCRMVGEGAIVDMLGSESSKQCDGSISADPEGLFLSCKVSPGKCHNSC